MRKYLALVAVLIAPTLVQAQSFDFTTFTLDEFPPIDGPTPEWVTTPSTAMVPDGKNAVFSVLYSPETVINKRIRGFVTPGTIGGMADNDFIGIVLGYQPGDTQSATADYWLLDWKGEDQFANGGSDPAGETPFHNLTQDTNAPVGLALSRVTGTPTGDELWGHVNDAGNASGGLEEITRGAVSGSAPFPRETGDSFELDVIYLADRIEVRVDGNLEIELEGSFPAGRFGVYTGWQSESPMFSSFQILPPFPPFVLDIDPSTGLAQVRSVAEDATELRSYSIESAGGDLNASTWSAQNISSRGLDSKGPGPGENWQEVLASAEQLFEAFLQGGTTLDPGETLLLGQIMDPLPEGADFPELTFDFVSGTPGGSGDSASNFDVTINVGPIGLDGDFNGDSRVDGSDFLQWQRQALTAGELSDWQSNYGTDLQSSALQAATVPEPTCCSILLGCLLLGATYGRR